MRNNFRAFDVMLFWDSIAWVAETVSADYWYVSQGRTPDEAIRSLHSGLMATAAFYLAEGKVPFKDRNKLPTPNDVVRRWQRAALLSDNPVPQKGRDYRLNVAADWGAGITVRQGEVTVSRSKRRAKGPRRAGRNR